MQIFVFTTATDDSEIIAKGRVEIEPFLGLIDLILGERVLHELIWEDIEKH